jgi:hypothetical protein
MSAPQNTAVSAAPPADSAEAPTRLAQIGRWSLMIIGSVAILAIVYFILWQTLANEVFFLGVLIVLLAGYFPLSYYAFQQSRAETRKRRIITDGKLLGLTNESEMESLYGEIYAPQQYAIYISMAVVTTVLGFALYYYANLPPPPAPNCPPKLWRCSSLPTAWRSCFIVFWGPTFFPFIMSTAVTSPWICSPTFTCTWLSA